MIPPTPAQASALIELSLTLDVHAVTADGVTLKLNDGAYMDAADLRKLALNALIVAEMFEENE